MAKKITAIIKLHIAAGAATPAPPVGPALAQRGVNIGEFTRTFNEKTKDRMGFKIPVDITVYEDKSFSVVYHEPPTAQLLKKAAGIEKGSGQPNKKKVGKVTKEQVRQIAEQKMKDLNTEGVNQAIKTVEGTAKSLGVEVE
ncbi:MAG: 50S ribosomal protein L11 [Candidatus Yanofskybacteria bacterium]|nr:50S ribosomal protein L11 [Candidatus Yanofskybacteria bacterium]